MTTGMQCWRIT